RRITNLAGGMADTDAVNVKQLRAVRDTPWTYTGNSGQTNQTMGSAVAIVGANTGATSAQNVKTVVTGGTKRTNSDGDVVYDGGRIEIQFAETPQFKGADMGGRKITSVADGTISEASKDAVNGSQLYSVKNSPITFAGNTGSVARKLGETQVIRGSLDSGAAASSSNIRTQVNPAGEMEILLANNLTADSLTINNGGPVINHGGIDMKGKRITQLAKGVDGSDAVNVDQLTEVSNVANQGWNLTANGADSSNVAPGATVDLANTDGNIVVAKTCNDVQFNRADDVGITNSLSVGGAFAVDGLAALNGGVLVSSQFTVTPGTTVNFVHNKVSGVADGEISSTSTEAINGSQLYEVASRPITFAGNEGSVERKLGETQVIRGSLDVAQPASSSNIRTQVNADGEMEILLANNLTADSLTINHGGPVISKDGIDMNGKRIRNLAKGIDGTDAVNVDQLTEVSDVANKGWNLTANGANSSNVAPGDTVDLANTDGNIDLTKAGKDVQFNLAKDIAVESVTTGDTVLNTDGVTINGGPNGPIVLNNTGLTAGTVIISSVTGINAGGFQITNVKAGVADTDAVNVSQLKGVQ